MKTLSGFDQEWLWHELAHAVRQQRPLPTALREIAETHPDTTRGRIARELGGRLARGGTLSQAVAEMGDQFPPGVAAALEAGERARRLPEVLDALSCAARAQGAFRSSILYAVTYPLILGLSALAVLLFVNFGIRPDLETLAADLELPVSKPDEIVRVLMQAGAFAVLLVPALALLLLYVAPVRCMPFRRLLDGLRMKVPLVGGVVRHHLLSRWCAGVGMLVRAGVAESAAVRLAGESVGNVNVEAESGALSARLEEGFGMGAALEESRFFPPMLAWTVQAAERAGGHSHVWPVAEELYRRQGEASAGVMSVALRTLFVLAAFLAVGVTVYSFVAILMQLMNGLMW